MMNGWDWRKASGGWTIGGEDPNDRFFHAYDPEDHAACHDSSMLGRSCEEPNEGSKLCPECMVVVREVDGEERAAQWLADFERLKAAHPDRLISR